MVAGFLIVARLWVSWALVHLSPPTTSTAFLFLLAFWCLCHAWQSCPMFAHSVWGLRCFCYFICPPPPLFSSFVFQFLSVFPGFLRLSPSIVGCVCLCRPLSPFLPSCVLLSPFVSSHVSPSLRGCPFCLCLHLSRCWLSLSPFVCLLPLAAVSASSGLGLLLSPFICLAGLVAVFCLFRPLSSLRLVLVIFVRRFHSPFFEFVSRSRCWSSPLHDFPASPASFPCFRWAGSDCFGSGPFVFPIPPLLLCSLFLLLG